MTHTNDHFSTYNMIMRCLDSEPYAGKEFQDKCFQFLDDSQEMTQEQRRAGWEKLHEEYELLSEPHWEKVRERIGNRELKQGELF
jgi:hypothetical protein